MKYEPPITPQKPNLPGGAGQDRGEVLPEHSFEPGTKPLNGGAVIVPPNDPTMPDG